MSLVLITLLVAPMALVVDMLVALEQLVQVL